MNQLRNGWFSESDCLWPGQRMSFKVDEVLYKGRSMFQEVLVFRSSHYGNVLALDDVVQCTEKDEFVYQEMMTHVPMFCHPCPAEVLVIGGGDGGIVREVVKHADVKRCTLCEIDKSVIDVSKKFFPAMAVGLESEKLSLHIGDGFEFLKNRAEDFDVIITDCSDEKGPGEFLFNETYFELVRKALKPGGIAIAHDDGPWLEKSLTFSRKKFMEEVFSSVSYYYISIPSYPSGELGFVIASSEPEKKFDRPCKEIAEDEVQAMQLKYYNADVHQAAFVLPQFTKDILFKSNTVN
eukprot:m.10759 g.10759  ORF g.10759 m.10759 type:complete len:294 (+) comp22635_c0_seq2:123-1004(+)